MSASTRLSGDQADAVAFAESVAGVLARSALSPSDWMPGAAMADPEPLLTGALDELGWLTLASDPELACFAGLAGVELGRRLAPVYEVDRLLGGGPLAGELVRSLRDLGVQAGKCTRVLAAEPVASSEGLEVWRVSELGETVGPVPAPAVSAWATGLVGYLAGLGAGALELTVDYVSQRRAFGSTLAALAPVQQLLADVATAVRGVRLLAAESCDADALAYAGPAIAEACAACQQVTGALGYTLEYPLHRFTQRARALGAWNP